MSRHLSLIDNFIINADRALRTLAAGSDMTCERPSPARPLDEAELSDTERKQAAALMRVNHTGEVCAQALYQGQALTAKLPQVRSEMEHAAEEEIDHLVWCQERIDSLGSHTSYLNPVWYGLSFAIGAGAGLVSDKVSLGFVAATEDQVCKHLQSHLEQLPVADLRSRAVIEKMLEDEAQHAEMALNAGGYKFPAPVKGVMTLVSKVMTTTSYRI
ncbi:2-polyprenyl-3-methyl-6-methoxy-1,4-benzoquinone monooxygenase [Cellvibrio sp. KY-GH-1]|uniref:2-polyprenyl-3-methyl-6-methoxy-1,4-benzoquinone monooxygenase n=1 Tax=Cellvibrio sp. KY-GH-1 TaxID=2303332 RepID=UPI0012488B30|nr:2-polyprenyl-3-methyl-6-methoxy-1,4-benzoquinone monooxygenase [Cellvibrio sp. KY-GH-1]QEY18654.1 2-polyprenyl-3-methyl-6-methoxy-1,4-benzoquinone monooxygenase [Cellvibrio sp. KY-GH-1]